MAVAADVDVCRGVMEVTVGVAAAVAVVDVEGTDRGTDPDIDPGNTASGCSVS